MIIQMRGNRLWGDMLYVPPTKEQELEVEEFRRDLDITRESHKMKSYADRQTHIKKGKVIRPCRWLYLEADGTTYSKHLTGASCWAWEYTDPKTKKDMKPHTCHFIHPNEFMWRDEWN